MENWRPGVLNKEQLIWLFENGKIDNANPDEIQDPSSIDLHITDIVYQLKGCVKPQSNFDTPTLISRFREKPIRFDKDDNISLKRSISYVFQVKESLNLDPEYSGQATGKSTFGRLDILTRLLTNHSDSYDLVKPGYNGALWIEVTPITFPIKLKKGMSLNQLRIFKGEPETCRISEENLGLWGDLIFSEKGEKIQNPKLIDNLTLNLNEDPRLKNGYCAYAVKQFKDPDDMDELDLTQDVSGGGYINSDDYWEKLKPSQDNPLALEIEPERFYILRSRERFKLPESVAIYCQAITETLGELRIHYAGFAHPCFGKDRKDDKGAPLIFEVRGHNIKAFLQHGETLAKLEYYFMSEDAKIETCITSYHDQELNLSKYFKDN